MKSNIGRLILFLLALLLIRCNEPELNPSYPSYFRVINNFKKTPLDIVMDREGNFYVLAFDTDSTSLVAKFDPNLKVIWSKLFNERSCRIKRLIITSDDKLLCVGKAIRESSLYPDAWTIKLDSDATVIWESFNGSVFLDQANSVIETNEGNFLVCGKTHLHSMSEERGDAYLFELSPSGATNWERVFSSIWDQEALSIDVVNSTSGKYALGTHSLRKDTSIASSYDIWLINKTAEKESEINLSGVTDSNGEDFWLITDDIGSILTRRSVAEIQGGALVSTLEQITSTGHIQWTHQLDNLIKASDVLIDLSGNYHVVARGIKTNPFSYEIRLMKFHNNGYKYYDEPFSSIINASPQCIIQVNTDKFLLGCGMELENNTFQGFYIFVNSEGDPIY